MKFADRLHQAILSKKSILCAGFDPRREDLPGFIVKQAQDDFPRALARFYELILPVVAPCAPIAKINVAFFEEYGLAGMSTFVRTLELARSHGLLTIADAKRGDIDSTAKAYASAYLKDGDFSVDALTVNPFLGFDTLEPFLEMCAKNDRGLFVLVRTSNPGSKDLQDAPSGGANTRVSDKIAAWIASNSASLTGNSGLSGLGAVVGATYPEEAANMRVLMPSSFFLIPGFGAQGGTAATARSGLRQDGGGGVINISRGLLGNLAQIETEEALAKIVLERAQKFNTELGQVSGT